METYRFSYIDIYYTDRDADFDIGCIVIIGRDRIEVKYDEEDKKACIWSGEAKGLVIMSSEPIKKTVERYFTVFETQFTWKVFGRSPLTRECGVYA